MSDQPQSSRYFRTVAWRTGAATGGLLGAGLGVWIIFKVLVGAAVEPIPLWAARAIVLAFASAGALCGGIAMLKLHDRTYRT